MNRDTIEELKSFDSESHEGLTLQTVELIIEHYGFTRERAEVMVQVMDEAGKKALGISKEIASKLPDAKETVVTIYLALGGMLNYAEERRAMLDPYQAVVCMMARMDKSNG